jgi:hypothetical protein
MKMATKCVNVSAARCRAIKLDDLSLGWRNHDETEVGCSGRTSNPGRPTAVRPYAICTCKSNIGENPARRVDVFDARRKVSEHVAVRLLRELLTNMRELTNELKRIARSMWK